MVISCVQMNVFSGDPDRNFRLIVKDGRIVIDAPLTLPGIPSKSGKSMVVYTTNGNITLDVDIDGEPLRAGINIYYRADD